MERWMCMEHLRICGGSGHWLFIFPSVKYNNMWKNILQASCDSKMDHKRYGNIIITQEKRKFYDKDRVL